MESIIARYYQIPAVDMEDTTTDLNSHADSPVVGDNATILFLTNKTVRVSGFTKVLGNIAKIPVVVAAITYTDTITGVIYLLIINNSLYMKEMEDNLIPPFMITLTNHGVDEFLKFLCKQSTINTHAITITNPELVIPLSLKGITCFMPTRKHTVDESKSCIINLIPNTSNWNPHSIHYAHQENCMLNYRGELVSPTLNRRSMKDSPVVSKKIVEYDLEISTVLYSIESAFSPRRLCDETTTRYTCKDVFYIK